MAAAEAMESGDAFIASLPAEEFESFEAELREVLINAAAKAQDRGLPGGRFPLQQWIDRRLGGEIRTTSDTQGQCEICLIRPNEPVAEADEANDFFETLSTESFSKEEEQLRDSIFEFLASWSSHELAELSNLRADAQVQACTQALLPASVPLELWIERRIGGEIEIHWDQGREVIQVTQEARKIVAEKCRAQKTAPRNRVPPPPPPPQQQAPPPPKPPQPPPQLLARIEVKGSGPGVAPKGQGAKGGKAPPISKEMFLQNLPEEELTGDEVNLRQALLDWLEAWRPGKGKGTTSAPMLNDALRDQKISHVRSALLPYNVPLQDWIEARIGGEIELRVNQKGQKEMFLRGAEAEEDAGGHVGDVDAILDGLPEDALTDEELDLRSAVLDLVASSSSMTVSALSTHSGVLAAKRKFLPEEVPLQEWINRRIGGEVEVTEDEHVLARGAEEQEAPPVRDSNGKGVEKGQAKAGNVVQDNARTIDNFFASLPSEELTDAEEGLRDAILTFMENWPAEERPPLSKAQLNPAVKQSRSALLPATVSLKDWIERRLGGELEILQNSQGNQCIGIRGDPGPAEVAKRGLEAAEWDATSGKARKLGP